MKLTIDTEEINALGYAKAILLGYLRKNPDFQRLYCIEDEIGISSTSLIHHLCDLEDMGYLKKIYAIKHKEHGRKIKGVTMLK